MPAGSTSSACARAARASAQGRPLAWALAAYSSTTSGRLVGPAREHEALGQLGPGVHVDVDEPGAAEQRGQAG